MIVFHCLVISSETRYFLNPIALKPKTLIVFPQDKRVLFGYSPDLERRVLTSRSIH